MERRSKIDQLKVLIENEYTRLKRLEAHVEEEYRGIV